MPKYEMKDLMWVQECLSRGVLSRDWNAQPPSRWLFLNSATLLSSHLFEQKCCYSNQQMCLKWFHAGFPLRSSHCCHCLFLRSQFLPVTCGNGPTYCNGSKNWIQIKCDLPHPYIPYRLLNVMDTSRGTIVGIVFVVITVWCKPWIYVIWHVIYKWFYFISFFLFFFCHLGMSHSESSSVVNIQWLFATLTVSCNLHGDHNLHHNNRVWTPYEYVWMCSTNMKQWTVCRRRWAHIVALQLLWWFVRNKCDYYCQPVAELYFAIMDFYD